MDIVNQIKNNGDLKNLEAKNGTVGIFLIGSLLHNNFIENWSDIDLIIISEGCNLNYLNSIDKAIKSLAQETNLKVGMEVFILSSLQKAVVNEICPGNLVKVAKNFHEKSDVWDKGVIFRKKEVDIPIFSLDSVKKQSVFSYTISVSEYINKYLLQNSDLIPKKAILRKLIKNSLLLMQTFLLLESHNLIINFSEVLSEFNQKYPQIDTHNLELSFSKRLNWGELNDADIQRDEIDANLTTLNSLAELILSSTS